MYRIAKYEISYVREGSFTIDSRPIRCRQDVQGIAKQILADRPLERVLIVALNNANSPIGITTFDGDTNQCAVFPAAVFRFLLSCGASGFIMAHNHPGGSVNFTGADCKLADALCKAGKLFSIPLIDSLIVTEQHVISMRESAEWPGGF